jgi:hypothetical protein
MDDKFAAVRAGTTERRRVASFFICAAEQKRRLSMPNPRKICGSWETCPNMSQTKPARETFPNSAATRMPSSRLRTSDFAGHDVFVRHGVPGADAQASGLGERVDLRADVRVGSPGSPRAEWTARRVWKQAKRSSAGHQLEDFVEQLDQVEPKLLEGLVPLTVPVRADHEIGLDFAISHRVFP